MKTVIAFKGEVNPRAFLRSINRQFVDAFRDLLKDHSTTNIVVFTVSDAELAALELAAQLHGDGNIHHYSKATTMNIAASDVSDFATRVRNGTAKLPARRKEGGV